MPRIQNVVLWGMTSAFCLMVIYMILNWGSMVDQYDDCAAAHGTPCEWRAVPEGEE